MTIVVVDDSITNLVVLKHLASDHSSAAVRAFSKPEEARDYLGANAADIIVVDCEMPGINGIDFIAQVRRLAQHAHTPIVMVTHNQANETRMRALAAGATDFLSKPVDPIEFKVRIRNLLRLKAPA